MTNVTVYIENPVAGGPPALFVKGVKPLGTVTFKSSVPGLALVFRDNWPFEGPDETLTAFPTVRRIRADAALMIYRFDVGINEDPFSSLKSFQLAVESDGIDGVGFSLVNQDGSFEVHTEQPVSAGAVTIFIENKVDQVANVSVSQEGMTATNTNQASIPVHATIQVPETVLGSKVTVQLVQLVDHPPTFLDSQSFRSGAGHGQSGGTKVIDIIVDPPG